MCINKISQMFLNPGMQLNPQANLAWFTQINHLSPRKSFFLQTYKNMS